MPLSGRRIGIEHTEFFFPEEEAGAPHKFQNERHQAVEMARSIFRANGGPPLYVTTVFQDDPEPMGPRSRRQRHDFARRFERVVREKGWPDHPHEHRPIHYHPEIPEIAYYMVSLCAAEADELWACGGAVTERHVEPRHVQSALDTKTHQHEDYAQKCDNVWLLIVNGGAIHTIPCELAEDARRASYSSPFDRAIWLDRFPPRQPVLLTLKK